MSVWRVGVCLLGAGLGGGAAEYAKGPVGTVTAEPAMVQINLCALERIRTFDFSLRRRALYPLSYEGGLRPTSLSAPSPRSRAFLATCGRMLALAIVHEDWRVPMEYYAQPYGYQPRPQHPNGTTVLVLGILGLVLFQPLGIAAWVMGNRVRRETSGPNAPYAPSSSASAGRILGIIATCLLIIGIVALLGVLFFVVASSTHVTIS